jgi:hypothetical protein
MQQPEMIPRSMDPQLPKKKRRNLISNRTNSEMASDSMGGSLPTTNRVVMQEGIYDRPTFDEN